MPPHLPANLLAKARQACRPSGGPARVKLVLKNGRIVYDVFVRKGGEIVMAGGRRVFEERELPFRPSDVVQVSAY